MPPLGASGAISGVLVAYLVFFPRARLSLLTIYRPVTIAAAWYVAAWFVLQLVYALVELQGSVGVAFSAHVGGFIAGVVFAMLYKSLTHMPQQ